MDDDEYRDKIKLKGFLSVLQSTLNSSHLSKRRLVLFLTIERNNGDVKLVL